MPDGAGSMADVRITQSVLAAVNRFVWDYYYEIKTAGGKYCVRPGLQCEAVESAGGY